VDAVTSENDPGVRAFGDELLRRLLTYTSESLPGAMGAGLLVADSEDDPLRSVAAVGAATTLDPLQCMSGEGPAWTALRLGEVVVLPHGEIADDWVARIPERTVDALPDQAAPLGAVFTPGEWGGRLPLVLSVYLDQRPDGAVLRRIDRYEPLVSQALAVVEYCSHESSRAEQMLQMMQYRRVIEQAKGLVMAAVGGDASGAFLTLTRASQHFNVRLRNLAVALVEHVGGATAEHPDDPALQVRPSEMERKIAERVWMALTAAPLASNHDETRSRPVETRSNPVETMPNPDEARSRPVEAMSDPVEAMEASRGDDDTSPPLARA